MLLDDVCWCVGMFRVVVVFCVVRLMLGVFVNGYLVSCIWFGVGLGGDCVVVMIF